MSEINANRIAIDTMRRSRVVSFDWDGTLVDSVPYKLAQNQAIAGEFGNKLTLEEVRQIWNQSTGFTELMKNLCQTDDMAKIMEVVRRDYGKPEYAKRRFDFSEELIKKLRSIGKKTALITNLTLEMLEIDAKSVGIDPLDSFFDHIQTAEIDSPKKPDPRVFLPLLKNLDALPSQVVYIGDETKDALAAKAAGVRFVGVESGMATAEEFAGVGAFSIRSLGDLRLKDS